VALGCALLVTTVSLDPVEAGRGSKKTSKSLKKARKAAKKRNAEQTGGFLLTSELMAKREDVAAGLVAVETSPGDYEAWSELGRALSRNGAFVDSLTAFERGLALDRESYRAWIDVGAAQIRIGDQRAAISSLNRAVELEPFAALAHYNLGVAKQQLGRYDEALSSFETALKIEPRLGDPKFNPEATNNDDLAMVKLRVYMGTAGATPSKFTDDNRD